MSLGRLVAMVVGAALLAGLPAASTLLGAPDWHPDPGVRHDRARQGSATHPTGQ